MLVFCYSLVCLTVGQIRHDINARVESLPLACLFLVLVCLFGVEFSTRSGCWRSRIFLSFSWFSKLERSFHVEQLKVLEEGIGSN